MAKSLQGDGQRSRGGVITPRSFVRKSSPQRGSTIVVRPIDFDPVDELKNHDAIRTALEQTGNILFIPIEILEDPRLPLKRRLRRNRA